MSNREGSIERLAKGSYRWRYFYRTPDGRRASKSGRAATRREAADAMALSRSATIRSGRTAPASVTLAEYLAEWLTTYTPTVRHTTAATTAKLAEAYILPRLGDSKLTEILPRTVERFLADLAVDGKRGVNGTGGLAPKSIRNIHGVLHRALDDAVRNDLILRNPAHGVRLPHAERPDLRVWDRDTLARFLEGNSADPMYPIWRLVASTGMRRGEVLGLRWSEVDLLDRKVRIIRARVSDGSRMVESLPKTRAGRRTISLDPVTRDALARLRDAQEVHAERLEMPPAAHVAANPDGSPLSAGSFRAKWRAAIARAGVPACRFHDLRHTFATMRLTEGVADHIVAGRLGHRDANTTRAIYAKYLPQTDLEEADAWGRALDDAVREAEACAEACADRAKTGTHDRNSGDTERYSDSENPNNQRESDTCELSEQVPPLGFEHRDETGEPK
jgi:integrase